MLTMATTALGIALQDLRRSLLCQDQAGLTDGDLLECFITRRDETAFAALVQRHGPMVLGVCRRVLGNEADAEDAFQATFLVLVRKVASITPRGMVGNWLYGVANTTALKARAMRTKRLAKEREAAARPKPESAAETWERLSALLDQELKALPQKCRAAIVLCDLEGKSIKEAARLPAGDGRHATGARAQPVGTAAGPPQPDSVGRDDRDGDCAECRRGRGAAAPFEFDSQSRAKRRGRASSGHRRDLRQGSRFDGRSAESHVPDQAQDRNGAAVSRRRRRDRSGCRDVPGPGCSTAAPCEGGTNRRPTRPTQGANQGRKRRGSRGPKESG